MGEAKQRRKEASALLEAVTQVSSALRRLATAASSHLGGDCYLHAELGRVLLADLGIEARRAIAHVAQAQGWLPAGAKGFAYHAWLLVGDTIIDFTTYQLRRKAAELDALDGGRTSVQWCPDFLLLRQRDVRSYADVAKLTAGLAYYEQNPNLESVLAPQFTLDASDLAVARLVMSNPSMNVMGPRS